MVMVKGLEDEDGAGLYWENGRRLTDKEGEAWWAGYKEGHEDGEEDAEEDMLGEIERLREALRDCHHVLHKLMAIVPGNDAAVDEMAKVMKKARAALGEDKE